MNHPDDLYLNWAERLDEHHIASLPPLPIEITVNPGERGDAVKLLQRALRSFGYLTALDGRFGPVTESCVRSFQAVSGIPRTGCADPATWRALGGVACA